MAMQEGGQTGGTGQGTAVRDRYPQGAQKFPQDSGYMAYEENAVKVRPTYGYYRQPDGFITASPSTDTDELKYRRGGWTPMRQYGSFEMATPYMANHPLEPLFMRGGAHELTVTQIITQGLYVNPPMVPGCLTPLGDKHKRHNGRCLASARQVDFPQLAGVKGMGPFPCTFGCGRELPTIEARDQHASVMHAPEKSDERTGGSLAAALLKGFGVGKEEADPARAEPSAPSPESAELLGLIASMRGQMDSMHRELLALKTAKAPVKRRRRTKVA